MGCTLTNLLFHAEILFSENGYHATSISQIAKSIGVTKQAVLYHFPKKILIYTAIIEGSANCLHDIVKGYKDLPPDEALIAFFKFTHNPDDKYRRIISLTMRDLLDNQNKNIEEKKKWFYKEFLDELEGVILKGQKMGMFQNVHARSFMYQLIGAVHYFIIAEPTLKQIYSAKSFEDHRKNSILQIETMIKSLK